MLALPVIVCLFRGSSRKASVELTRVLGYVLGIAHLWWQRALWLPAQRGLYAVIGGCHLGLALNLYWSTFVVGALFRVRSRGAARD